MKKNLKTKIAIVLAAVIVLLSHASTVRAAGEIYQLIFDPKVKITSDKICVLEREYVLQPQPITGTVIRELVCASGEQLFVTTERMEGNISTSVVSLRGKCICPEEGVIH